MSKITLILTAAMLFIAPTQAAILGILVSSEITTTVTGMSAWKCTYSVAGRNITVVLKEICPSSMNFE